MDNQTVQEFFTDGALIDLFPPQRTSDFFEALFGDNSEGAYDVKLRYGGYDEQTSNLELFLDLHERPGSCLVCSLTYGLPQVFSRHPVINIKGLVKDIEQMLGGLVECGDWKLGSTIQSSKGLHSIPLSVALSVK